MRASAKFGLCLMALVAWSVPATAQDNPPRPAFNFPPPVVSPEVAADRKVTFRLYAPKATAVKLTSSDIPGIPFGGGLEMKKADNGVWAVTTEPLGAGSYRYHFDADGLSLNDPATAATSESNSNSWSLVVIPGSEFQDTKDVPHGTVARLTYYSNSLKRFRRMHVYAPPGYEVSTDKLPVLYLLHGAMDCDDSWSSVGRAGFILDNLIAAGKAKPMLVVMPMGHTGAFRFGPGDNSLGRQMEEFITDFSADIRPTIEKTYRVRTDRAGRAIAGLSMGGAHTLDITVKNLADYAYIGVFSSGVFGIAGGAFQPPGPKWEDRHQTALDNAELKKGLELVWFATGKEDFLRGTSQATVDMLKKHGFSVVYKETEGGHTWINWRDYLTEFAPMLFNK